MMTAARQAWELLPDEFTGPAIALPIFEIDGRSEEYDQIWEEAEAGGLREIWRSACGCYRVGDLDWEQGPALVMYHLGMEGRVAIGFYLRGQCWIDEAWRGRGLAVELILAASALVGGSPTCNPEGMGFSEAGLAVHRKAHRIAVERALAAGHDVPIHVLEALDLNGRGYRR